MRCDLYEALEYFAAKIEKQDESYLLAQCLTQLTGEEWEYNDDGDFSTGEDLVLDRIMGVATMMIDSKADGALELVAKKLAKDQQLEREQLDRRYDAAREKLGITKVETPAAFPSLAGIGVAKVETPAAFPSLAGIRHPANVQVETATQSRDGIETATKPPAKPRRRTQPAA